MYTSAQPRHVVAGGSTSRAVFAVRRARQAQKEWADEPVRRRLAKVAEVRRWIGGHAAEIARTVHPERRTLAETLAAEVMPLADACRFLERRGERLLSPRRIGGRPPWWLRGTRLEQRREPCGVVLVIGPANYPLFLPGVQALQALAAGNAVVVKPGRGGRRAMEKLAEVLAAAGLDPDLFAVLDETVEAARTSLREGVDKVLLTGSAETGRAVLGELAPALTPAAVELSGCDAVFVRPDADLGLAVRALRFGLLANGGATCIAPRRVFVHRALAGELESRLREALADAPPVPVEPAVADTVAALVDDAVARGARIVAGGRPADGLAPPTVLAGATPQMAALRADVFAPLVSLVVYDHQDEALRLAGGCPYALGATVFGAEPAARELAARVDAGVVVVNDMIAPTADPRVTFGGRRQSGFGVTRGAEGLLELTRPKTVIVCRGRWRPHLDPVDPHRGELLAEFLSASIRQAHAGGFLARLGALYRMIANGRRLARRTVQEENP